MSLGDSINDARAYARAEIDKSTSGIRAYVHSFITSRLALALATAFFLAFTVTAIYSPTRLAPISGLGFVQAGLIAPPPVLDLSTLGVTEAEQRAKIAEARAQGRPYLQRAYIFFLEEYPSLPLWLNIAGAALSGLLLAYTAKLQVRAARQR
jgi:hypothetical protein